ncbi:hypothetical protein [Rodentibacter myodis]|uniref:Uncharacterized protein n=1 Tax=Rodentibacter myodis TaxID=1907939 RepID=A0A1V3JTH7_9PAST|nr:hypothetical protein [Rodentibacter myodis]OOF59743.1 hypothetical protein BKL49_02855 [Rodentibacter myodis]
MKYEIILEDKGQDLHRIITEADGKVIDVGVSNYPIENAYIPVSQLRIGELCKMHNPPSIHHGYLNYKVVEVNTIGSK